MKPKAFRRLLALCLSLLLVSGLSSAAFAAEDVIFRDTTNTGVVWELKANGTLALKGKGSLFDPESDPFATDDVVLAPWNLYTSLIRKVVMSNGITEIPEMAFINCDRLTSVSFPNTLKKIGDSAFSYCTALKKITLPASVSFVGLFAFDETGWYKSQKDGVVYCGKFALSWKGDEEPTAVKFKKGTTHISPFLLGWKSTVKSISLPEGLKSIGELAFVGTGITSITIPASVSVIGEKALNHCDALKTITVKSGNKRFSADQNTALYNNKTSTLIRFAPAAALKAYAVKKNTKAIADYAFYGAEKLKKITIANTVKTIGDFAFGECAILKSIHIPDSVKSIGDYAFSGGYELTSVTGGKGITSLGDDVFSETLWCYQHENGPLYIGSVLANYIGFYSGAKVFKIKEGTTAIAPFALKNVSKYLQAVSLPSTLKTIGTCSFSGAKITSLSIPGSVQSIDESAFDHCPNLKTVNISEGLREIGPYAFSDCAALSDLHLPNSLKTIGNYAFSLSGLSEFRIPAGLQKIGNDPVTGKAFKRYIVDEENAFFSADENGILFNKEKTALFDCPSGFSKTRCEVPAGVTEIRDYAFNDLKKLTEIVLPDGLTAIGSYSFHNCAALKSISLPGSVVSIDAWAFSECASLASVQLSSKLKALATGIFNGCEALTAIKIPGSAAIIGDYAFSFCEKLKKVVVSEGVKSILSDAFDSCTSLTGITLPKSMQYLDCWAFYGSKNLQKIVIKSKNLQITDYNKEHQSTPFPPKTTIYAPAGSTAQSYCKSYHIKFQTV